MPFAENSRISVFETVARPALIVTSVPACSRIAWSSANVPVELTVMPSQVPELPLRWTVTLLLAVPCSFSVPFTVIVSVPVMSSFTTTPGISVSVAPEAIVSVPLMT
jgi:hypothetical protein